MGDDEEEARRLFQEADLDSSGGLDLEEIQLVIDALGFSVDERYVSGVLQVYDLNGDGTLDEDEFVELNRVVIGRALGSADDPNSEWSWRASSYRYREAGTEGSSSDTLSAEEFRFALQSGVVEQSAEVQVKGRGAAWRPWEPLSRHLSRPGFAKVFAAETPPSFSPPGSSPVLGSQSSFPTARELFAQYDADDSGTLDRDEVRALLAQRTGLSTADTYLDGILDAFDADHSGTIDIDEFEALHGAVSPRDAPRRASQAEDGDDYPEDFLDSEWYWRGVSYQCWFEDSGEGASITFEELEEAVQIGLVVPATMLRVSSSTKETNWGEWGQWSAFVSAYAGLRSALDLDDDHHEDDESVNFWKGLQFRYKVNYDEDTDQADGLVFGFVRQKVLTGEITDATLIQIQDPDSQEWGDWTPLSEARATYEGLSAAVGKAIAHDSLMEYKAAFSVYDKDGNGSVSKSELAAIMQSLGKILSEDQLTEMMRKADMDDSGEVDFNEFLSFMTQKIRPQKAQIHVRGIGAHGWDGTDDGEGEYESEDALAQLFGRFGKVWQVTIRHRIQDPNSPVEKLRGPRANTSWALVTMKDRLSADQAVAASEAEEGLMAGTGRLKVTHFSNEVAKTSTGGMAGVLKADQQAGRKIAGWALQQYRYRTPDRDTSDWLCIGELQELVVDGTVDDSTQIFTDRFDSFMALGDACEVEPDLALALSYDYVESFYTSNDTEMTIVEARAAMRSGDLAPDTMIWCDGMPAWAPLQDVLWKLGLSHGMEIVVVDGANESVSELEAIFKELDTDSSGFLDRHEVHQALAKLKGREPSEDELNAALGDMLGQDGGDQVDLAEFSQWYQAKQYTSASGDVMEALAALMAPARKVYQSAGPRVKRAKTMDITKTSAVKLGSLKHHAGLLLRQVQSAPKDESTATAAETEPEDSAPVHVRGIGAHGWDGTDDGEGEYESEDALAQLFGRFGEVVQVTIRHRIQDPNSPVEKLRGPRANTSWALVTMADKLSADQAVAASEAEEGLMAGTGRLKVTHFSKEVAKTSTGKMAAVLKADEQARSKMTKRWCVIVSVDDSGMAVSKSDSGRRAAVFFASKNSLLPVEHILSDVQGIFNAPQPMLTTKLITQCPHCFALAPTADIDVEGNATEFQIHVRGIGAHGWDGTDDGEGEYESEDALAQLFGRFGEVVQVTIRHRIQDPNSPVEKLRGPRANTSWALVTMAHKLSADQAVAASEAEEGLMAGTGRLKVTHFSKEVAKTSTGKMAAVMTADKAHILATRNAADRSSWLALLQDRKYTFVKKKHCGSELAQIFQEMYGDYSGQLDSHKVGELLSRMGQRVSADNLHQTMASIDNGGCGEVSFQELEDWWNQQDPALMSLMSWTFFDATQLVSAVASVSAPFNWLLAKLADGDLQMIKAGSRGIHEISDWINGDDCPMYAFVRFEWAIANDSQIHVRGIGAHGWDGTDDGEGEYESEDALAQLFGRFGEVVQVTIRHRIQDPNSPVEKLRGPRANTSWALVTMAHKLSADQAVAASEAEEGLMAGTGRLKVTHFSKEVAKTSTGKMGSLSPRTRKWLTIRCQNADDSGSIVKDKQARVALSPHDIFFTATPADLTSAASIVRRLESALVENEISDGWDGMCLAACEQILDQERNKRLRALVAKQVKVPPSSLRPRVSEAIPPGMAAHGSKTAHPLSQCVRQATATAENGSRDGQDDETSDEDESSDDEFDSDDEDYERQRHYPTIGREASGVRVVVDEGYGSTRFGIAGEDMPTVLSNTINAQSNGNFMHVIERQKLDAMCVDWSALEAQWYHMFETELDVEGENCSVLCTISPYGSLEYAETLGELLFETFDTMGLYFANPSLLSLYAQGKTTGLVVDSGECTTSAFPVYEGMINKHAVKTIPFGGRDITEYIKRELTSHYEGLSLTDYGTHELVRQMKEELCYCGEPRDAPSKCYKLPDGQMLTVDAGDSFPFRAPEFFFFDPLRLDWSDTQLEQSVPSMIFQSVMESPIDARKKLTENVLLAGGNTMFDGLPEMLFKKLKGEGKARAGSLRVNATSVRCHSAWLGGTIVAKMPKYEDQLVTVDEYEEEGPKSVHRHNVLADDMAG